MINNTMTKPQFKKAMDLVIQKINDSSIRNGILDVILYGSVARGQERYDSDIDILFILDKIDKTNRREVIYLKGNLSGESIYDTQIDAKFLTKNSWEQDDSYYIQKVRKEGVSIWTPN